MTEEERLCEHCGAPLPPLPPIPQPPPAYALAAVKKQYRRALERHRLLARPHCRGCELTAAAREDERYLRSLGMRPMTAEERERERIASAPNDRVDRYRRELDAARAAMMARSGRRPRNLINQQEGQRQ